MVFSALVVSGIGKFLLVFVETEGGQFSGHSINKVKLSAREIEVLEYICKGYSNAEIAKELGLSQRTIDGHKSRLFDKTGAKNAPNLVLFAIKNGIVEA